MGTNDVILGMSQGDVLTKTDPDKSTTSKVAQQTFFERRIELMSKLSALVDYGRFFSRMTRNH